jgi:hypothetical protein
MKERTLGRLAASGLLVGAAMLGGDAPTRPVEQQAPPAISQHHEIYSHHKAGEPPSDPLSDLISQLDFGRPETINELGEGFGDLPKGTPVVVRVGYLTPDSANPGSSRTW